MNNITNILENIPRKPITVRIGTFQELSDYARRMRMPESNSAEYVALLAESGSPIAMARLATFNGTTHLVNRVGYGQDNAFETHIDFILYALAERNATNIPIPLPPYNPK